MNENSEERHKIGFKRLNQRLGRLVEVAEQQNREARKVNALISITGIVFAISGVIYGYYTDSMFTFVVNSLVIIAHSKLLIDNIVRK